MNAGEAARQVRIDQAQDDEIKTAQHAYRDDGGAKERRRTQRHRRMIEHGGESQAEQAVDLDFALTSHEHKTDKRKAKKKETQEHEEAAQKKKRQTDGRQGLDDFSVDETNIPY